MCKVNGLIIPSYGLQVTGVHPCHLSTPQKFYLLKDWWVLSFAWITPVHLGHLVQDFNDAWITVTCVLLLPKLKIFHSLVLLVKLVCQFCSKNLCLWL